MDFAENISLIEQVNNIINPIRKNILPSLFFLIAIANWLIMSIPPLIIEISNKIKNSVKTIGFVKNTKNKKPVGTETKILLA